MGFLSRVRDSITGAGGRRQARRDVRRGNEAATAYIQGAYPGARQSLTDSRNAARGEITGGYDRARGDVRTGFAAAKGRYDAPEIVQSRQQLYQRMMGQGGYQPDQLEQMKAGAREEYGTLSRDLMTNLNSYYGDSAAPGLAGENLARGMTQLGADRARQTRDIDIRNADLIRQEQGSAIDALQREAGERAGIDEREGAALGELSQNEANILANLENTYGLNLANLTTEEAQLLASIAAGGGAQMAATRNTAGMMPLFAGFAQGAGEGLGMAASGGRASGGRGGG